MSPSCPYVFPVDLGDVTQPETVWTLPCVSSSRVGSDDCEPLPTSMISVITLPRTPGRGTSKQHARGHTLVLQTSLQDKVSGNRSPCLGSLVLEV